MKLEDLFLTDEGFLTIVNPFKEVGVYTFSVIVSDGELSDQVNVKITVLPARTFNEYEGDSPLTVKITSVSFTGVVTLEFSEPIDKT